MVTIRKMGAFLKADAEGYLGKECELSKVQSPWKEAVEEIVQAYLSHHSEAIHSLYLRGSLPRGLALPGVSDIDTFAVVRVAPKDLKLRWIEEFRRDFLRRHPMAAGLEIQFFPLEPLLYHRGTFSMRFTIKHLSVCLYGEDLGASIPSFRPDLNIAYAFHGRLGEEIVQVQKWLESPRSPQEIRRACEWIMKRIVRTGFAILIPQEQAYTRDLYLCYETFARHYPEQSEAMYQALQLAIVPSENTEVILAVLSGLGSWLRLEADKIYRKSEV